jgi:hypothetical protein
MPVVPGIRRRQDFRQPIGRAADAAAIALGEVAQDEDVWLHDRVDHFVCLCTLRETDVDRCYVGSAGFALKSHADLVIKLTHELLM